MFGEFQSFNVWGRDSVFGATENKDWVIDSAESVK